MTLRMCHITGFCHTYNNDDWIHFIYIYKYTRRVRTHKYGFGEEWPSCPAPADLTQREKKWAWLTVVLTWPADPPTRCIRAINTLKGSDRSMTFKFTCLPQRENSLLCFDPDKLSSFRFPPFVVMVESARLFGWPKKTFECNTAHSILSATEVTEQRSVWFVKL